MKKLVLFFFLISLFSCEKEPEGEVDPVFKLSDEKILSEFFLEEIRNNPSQYGDIIPDTLEKFVYRYVNRVKDSIINSQNIVNKTAYDWNIYLINDSFDISAYGLPGAQIFISTGLLLFLEGEDELAAILSREIHYLDKGIALNKLTDFYGIPLILETFSDTNKFNIPPMIDLVRSQPYSISNEKNGDLASVNYLCDFSYRSDALGIIYQRSLTDSVSILSKNFQTYPLDSSRIKSITTEASIQNCIGNNKFQSNFQIFKDSISL
jgi:hypothetical protein